ncbi:hypothetical protein PWT90_02447 [Aphanocladium album]|nr:hypothetical protein PWT90_02447 [Aphanocladium album]
MQPGNNPDILKCVPYICRVGSQLRITPASSVAKENERCNKSLMTLCDGDGTDPCKACLGAGTKCAYLTPMRVSKAELREELARLQSENSDNCILLDAISSRNTSPSELNEIIQRLADGQPRAEVAEMIARRPSTQDSSSRGGSPALSTPVTASVSPLSSGPSLASGQDAWTRPVIPDNTPSICLSSFYKSPIADLDYYRTRLPQILDAILTRDCLIFCPINKDAILRAFASSSGSHYSTALMDAILALATLLAQDAIVDIALALPPRWSQHEDIGDLFAQEAVAGLYSRSGLPQHTADIQALGVLSLYCLGRGKISDAQGFASDFGAAITKQWRRSHSLQPGSSPFPDMQAHANIYCAAVSFNRLLFLMQDYNDTLDELAAKVGMELFTVSGGVFNNGTEPKSDFSSSILEDWFFADLNPISGSPVSNSPNVIAAKLFELTEWIYQARYCSEKKTLKEVVRLYQESLRCTINTFCSHILSNLSTVSIDSICPRLDTSRLTRDSSMDDLQAGGDEYWNSYNALRPAAW